jgi:hypothetical protein
MDETQKDLRRTRKYLKQLVKDVTAHIKNMDEVMKGPSTFERGKTIAKLINELDIAKDIARAYGLDINLQTGKKNVKKHVSPMRPRKG